MTVQFHTGDRDADRSTDQPADAPRDRAVVERRIRTARDTLPGQRDALPPGALGEERTMVQGDENRDPPANAPTPPP